MFVGEGPHLLKTDVGGQEVGLVETANLGHDND